MPNIIYNIHNLLGVKYLTTLRIEFSHLKDELQDSINPVGRY